MYWTINKMAEKYNIFEDVFPSFDKNIEHKEGVEDPRFSCFIETKMHHNSYLFLIFCPTLQNIYFLEKSKVGNGLE